jgi:hypothetical protein
MTIVMTYAQLNRKIRSLNKQIKLLRNEKKYWLDAAAYHQAVIDDIMQKYNLDPSFNQFFPDEYK